MLLSDTRSFAGFMMDAVGVFIVVLWLWLLAMTMSDLLRRHDVSDVGKFFWAVLLIALPYVGVFTYIGHEGAGMAERKRTQAEAARDAIRQLLGVSVADELLKLDQLRALNIISKDEYLVLRGRLVG